MKPVYPPIGFHGDQHLLELVACLATKVDYFVETGTNIAATMSYFAEKYKEIHCFGCEPDGVQFRRALDYTSSLSNVKMRQMKALQFLQSLHPNIYSKPVLFWLDAHGRGFEWQLRDEIRFITSKFTNNCFILIDDFKVPNKKMFQFDQYAGQVCSYNYIKNRIQGVHYLYYPNYEEHTSQYHPLVGWGLIEIGISDKPIDLDIVQICSESM